MIFYSFKARRGVGTSGVGVSARRGVGVGVSARSIKATIADMHGVLPKGSDPPGATCGRWARVHRQSVLGLGGRS